MQKSLEVNNVFAADSAEEQQQSTETDTILGSAIRFGIVTGTFTLAGDAETNVAARHAVYESAQTGNTETNEVEQEFIFGSVDVTSGGNKLLLKGKKAFVRCTESDKNKITHASPTDKLSFDTQNTEDQLNRKVQDMMDHVSAKSEIAGKSASDVNITYGQDQKYYLNIKDKPDGTYYVNVDNVDKDSFGKIMSRAEKFRIEKKPNQTIIFNVSADGDLSMQKYSINGVGTDSLLSSGNDVTKTIIWNFTGSGKLDLEGSVSGVIIAPHRDVTTIATGSGWIVSNSVTINRGEWHNTYQKLTPPDKNTTPPDTHEEEKTEVSVTKVWDDNNNAAGNRPDANKFKSCIKLMNGQTEVTGYEPEVTDNKDGTYTVKYSGLPKTENGKYTVQEDNVPGYTTQKNTAANGGTIRNKAETTETKTTSVTITKKWEDNSNTAGNRPSAEEFKSKIKLMNGENEVRGHGPVITDNGNGTYTVKYSGLPKMENGKEVKYTVQEDTVPGYTTQKNTAANGETITNKAETTETKTTSVTITKKWEDNNNTAGNRPSAEEFKSKIKLMNGLTEVTGHEPEVIDNGNGTYTVEYTGLPKTEADGSEITYKVSESPVVGYKSENPSVLNGGTIINKAETTSVTITKKWEDNNNAAGNRPSAEEFKSKIKLMNGENEVTEYEPEVTDNGNGTYTVKYTGLPKMENGKEVKYTVQEDNIPGYTTQNNEAENNGIITNTIKPNKPTTPDKPNRNGSFPQTGDNSNLPLYAAAFAVSAVGLGVLLIARRKKNHKVK